MPDTLQKLLEFAALFAVALAIGWAFRRIFGAPTVKAADVHQRLAGGGDVLLLDVRTPEEFARNHIEGSLNVPLPELGRRLTQVAGDLAAHRDTPVVLVCASGSRAQAAARLLKRAGLRDVRVMAAGMIGWGNCGLPVKGTRSE